MHPEQAIALPSRAPRSRSIRSGLRIRARLHVILLVAAFIGYPLVSLLPTLVGMETRIVSVPYRGFIVVASLLLLLLYLQSTSSARRLRAPVLWFWLAWTAMMLRFLFDVEYLGVQPSPYFLVGGEFLLFVIGAGLIPALPLMHPMNPGQLRSAHRWLAVLTAVVVLIYAWKLDAIAQDATEMARAQTGALNAITYGSLGATLIILALLYPADARARLVRPLSLGAALALGGWALITSASRGPLLALLIVVVATMMARSRNRRTAILVALGALALLAIAATVLLPMVATLSDESLLASRIEGFEDDASTLERLYLLQASWDIFVSNPLLGGAIAEPVTHLYPHNIILEALMVGGIGLGLLITAIVVYCLKRAYALIAARDQRSFIGGIAIFTVIMAMTSGSLYTGPEFWYVFALLIAQHPGHNSDRRPPATNLQAP